MTSSKKRLLLIVTLIVTLTACELSNRPPAITLGSDRTVDLLEPVDLTAQVSDDGLPSATLLTTWRKTSGPGEVTFSDPSNAAATATFSRPGTYRLELTATDTELTSRAEMTFVVLPEGGSVVASLTQAGQFATGYAGGVVGGELLTVPSTDPAGLTYYPPNGHLFITDSEINEIDEAFSRVQANIFETSLTGDVLYNRWDITPNARGDNKEPTGIAYCLTDEHFYISNDNKMMIYRHSFDGTNLEVIDQISTADTTGDPEDITCDPATGDLYVVGGSALDIAVYRYEEGFKLVNVLDLLEAGAPGGIPSDPEGIAFDATSRHLFVVSTPDEAIFEYTTAGRFVNKFSLASFVPRPDSPQGLTIGPASGDPTQTSIYIADGGRDNNSNPEERDGRIYEARITRETP